MVEGSILERNKAWLRELVIALRCSVPSHRMARLSPFTRRYRMAVVEKLQKQARRWKLPCDRMLARAIAEDALLQIFHPGWRIRRRLPIDLLPEHKEQITQQEFLHDLAQRYLAQQQPVAERKASRTERMKRALTLASQWSQSPIEAVPDNLLLEETSFYLWFYRACELLRESSRWEAWPPSHSEFLDHTELEHEPSLPSTVPSSEEHLAQEEESRLIRMLLNLVARDWMDLKLCTLKKEGYSIREAVKCMPEGVEAPFLTNRWTALIRRFRFLFVNYTLHLGIPGEPPTPSELYQQIAKAHLSSEEKAMLQGFWLWGMEMWKLLEWAEREEKDVPKESTDMPTGFDVPDETSRWWQTLNARCLASPWKGLCEVWRQVQWNLAPHLKELWRSPSISQVRTEPSLEDMKEYRQHLMWALVKAHAKHRGFSSTSERSTL